MMHHSTGLELPAEFFKVAKNVYQGDPYWVPENEASIRQQFSADNPYFDHCEAKIFCHGDQARLVGFFNPELIIEDEKVAYFGYWETENSLAINQGVFALFEEWAKTCDASRIYGPINFSTYQGNRLKVDSFDRTPFSDEPYNPNYYPDVLGQLGYEKKYGYVTAINHSVDRLVKQINTPFSELKNANLGDFVFEKLTGDVWLDNLEALYPLVDAIFSQNFAYSKISWQSFKSMCGDSFAKKLCPKSSVMVRDKEGQIAGFFITYPDYGSLVNQSAIQSSLKTEAKTGLDKHSNLRASDLNYAEHYPLLQQPRLLLAKTCGVAPKYRSAGLFPLMSMQLTIWAQGLYEHIASAMVREDNPSMSFYKSLVKAGNKDFLSSEYTLFTKSVKKQGS
jgi:hypothetical protein